MSALAPLVVILGPTASGKSSLAIRLARQLNGEVLVCDSTQVYRHFDIGTAKVPLAEQEGIAHHLVDLVEPDEIFTAGEYRRRALLVLGEVTKRGKLPILTAGTGLYLRALLEGLADAPERSEELRARLRTKAQLRGSDHLHRALMRLDPENAARIGPRDTQKVIRAIEMRILAGKPVAEIHRAGRSSLEGYDIQKIGLVPPRAALYARIDARAVTMLRDGWLDEVRKLSSSGISVHAKPFQFIGYAELLAHLAGRLTMEAALEKIQQATRQFAKRQLTWFRKEPSVHWLPGFGDDPEIAAAALAFLRTPRA
ncbi:MAG: tRNA (adenosine(37)-N6)-dimethylallyltransferase MiaA [Candidatus Acidiferrales bacterium]